MRTSRLGNHVEILSGFAFKSGRFNTDGKGLPLVRIRDVKPAQSGTYFDGDYDERFTLSDGDLLVGMDGEFNCARWKGGRALLNQRVCRIRSGSAELDEQYLFWFLPKALKDIEDKSNFVTVKHLSAKQIDEIEIPLPPLDEQKRIAAILDQADELRRKRQRAIDRLNQLGQAIFHEMFGDPVANPFGWPVRKLGEIGVLDRGVSKHRPRNDSALLGGEHPLIQTGDVANADSYIRSFTSTYSDLGLKQSKKWPIGTLCITIAANIGKTAILDIEACFPDSVVGFTPSKETNAEYVQFWMSCIQKRLEEVAPQSAQKNINLAILRELPIPMPPRQSQDEFRTAIREIELHKASLWQSADSIGSLFAALQHRAFQGEL